MFQRSAVGTRVSTRSQSQNVGARTLATARNEDVAVTSRVQKGPTAIVAKQFAVSTTTGSTVTRKRRALHDVTNNQAPAVPGDKAATGKSVTRVKAVPAGKAILQSAASAAAAEPKRKVEKVASVATAVATAKTSQAVDKKIVDKAAEAAREADRMTFEPKALHVIVLESPKFKRQKTEGELVSGWDNLDTDDAGDITMASEFVVEIFDYMRHLEKTTLPVANYMDTQKELQWKMRSILIDWLVEVHQKFRLLPETLFLAVNLIDRFLSKRAVSLSKLQLVGMTALFIAAKYEEVFAPSINQFVYIADKCYSNEDIIKAERYLLSTLNFNIQHPNPLNFLRRCSKADDYDLQTRTVAKYLMELTLMDEAFITCTPSIVAAAALYLGRVMLDRQAWDVNLQHYSGYTVAELQPVCLSMLDYLRRDRRYNSIYTKYSSTRFMKASVFVEEWVNNRSDDFECGIEWE